MPNQNLRCSECKSNLIRKYIKDDYNGHLEIIDFGYCGNCGKKLHWNRFYKKRKEFQQNPCN